jgi:hypothetical protein
MLPLRLTHTILADLVAAQRPTISGALADLQRRDIVRATTEGWLLLRPPPEAPRSNGSRGRARL